MLYSVATASKHVWYEELKEISVSFVGSESYAKGVDSSSELCLWKRYVPSREAANVWDGGAVRSMSTLKIGAYPFHLLGFHPHMSNQGQYFEDVARLAIDRSIRVGSVPHGGFRNRFTSKSSSYQIMLSPASLCRFKQQHGVFAHHLGCSCRWSQGFAIWNSSGSA